MEIQKIVNKINPYLVGQVADIGCGDSVVIEGAFGIDGRDFPCVKFLTYNLYDLPTQMPDKIGYFDTVVSSHVLEHLPDSYRAIIEWRELLKIGGTFILYLPDGEHYNNYENQEHFHDFTYKQFMFWFKRTFCGEANNFKGDKYAQPYFEIIDSGTDYGENKYSFYLIAKRLR